MDYHSPVSITSNYGNVLRLQFLYLYLHRMSFFPLIFATQQFNYFENVQMIFNNKYPVYAATLMCWLCIQHCVYMQVLCVWLFWFSTFDVTELMVPMCFGYILQLISKLFHYQIILPCICEPVTYLLWCTEIFDILVCRCIEGGDIQTY